MGLMVKEGQGQAFPAIPPDVYQAVCYGLYDLGSHYDEKYKKLNHQCLIMWEIPDVRISITKDGTTIDKPRTVSRIYTMSLGEKSNLRKDLQSWRGRPFSDQELQGFDLKNILGTNCMIQIINTEKNGKQYNEIANILPLFKGMQKKDNENPLMYFALDESDSIPPNTPQWIWEKIKTCTEMQKVEAISDAGAGNDPVDDVPF